MNEPFLTKEMLEAIGLLVLLMCIGLALKGK